MLTKFIMKKFTLPTLVILTLCCFNLISCGNDDGNHTILKSSEKQITSFIFTATDNDVLDTDVVAVIDEDTKTVIATVPFGTNVTALIPTLIISEEATVDPESAIEQDFSDPIDYLVEAQDGTTQAYKVSVNISSNTEKQITSFIFTATDNDVLDTDVVAVIDEEAKTITATVPFNTDVTTLIPSISFSGTTISPNSDVAQDFSNPVTYTVTAENSSTANYDVTVNVEGGSSEKQIIEFTFRATSNSTLTNDITSVIDQEAKTITATVPFGTDVTALIASITISEGATINPNNEVELDFSNPVTYTVTAEDSSTVDYKVNVTLAKSNEAVLFSFIIDLDEDVDAIINEEAKTVTAEVPLGTDLTTLTINITVSEGATTNLEDLDFTTESILIVTAEDGETTAEYIVTLTLDEKLRIAERAALIDFYYANGGNTNTAFDTWDVEDEDSDISDWAGININNIGLVSGFNMNNKNISTIPESFADLTELTFLNLSINNLNGFPEVITTLTKLENLYIGINNIQSLPESIDNLAMLEEFNLYDVDLQSLPASFINLTNLTFLSLEANSNLTLSEQECNFVTSISNHIIDPGKCP